MTVFALATVDQLGQLAGADLALGFAVALHSHGGHINDAQRVAVQHRYSA
jgi:hypothetical protein